MQLHSYCTTCQIPLCGEVLASFIKNIVKEDKESDVNESDV